MMRLWIPLIAMLLICTAVSQDLNVTNYQVDIYFLSAKSVKVVKEITIKNFKVENISIGRMYVPVTLGDIDASVAVNNLRMLSSRGHRIFSEVKIYDGKPVITFSIDDALHSGEEIKLTLEYLLTGEITAGILFKEFTYPLDRFTLPINFYRVILHAPEGYRITWRNQGVVDFPDDLDRWFLLIRYRSPVNKPPVKLEFSKIPFPLLPVPAVYVFWGFWITILLLIIIHLLRGQEEHINIEDLLKKIESGKEEDIEQPEEGRIAEDSDNNATESENSVNSQEQSEHNNE